MKGGKKMHQHKGELLLGLILFLAMFLIPFVALGNSSSEKSNNHSQADTSQPSLTAANHFFSYSGYKYEGYYNRGRP
jgi:hypothetical protein